MRLWCVPGRGNRRWIRHGLNARADTTGRNLVGGVFLVPSDLIPVLEHVIHDAGVPLMAPQRQNSVADAKRCDGRLGCDSRLLAAAGARDHQAPPGRCRSGRLGKLPQAISVTAVPARQRGRRFVEVIEAYWALVHR